MDRIMVDVVTGEITTIQLTQQEINDIISRQPTKTQLKNKEIKDRTDQYKSDLRELQFNWLSASVADGDDELTKKQQIQQDLIDLKTEYNTDILNIKSKYAN